MFNPSSENWNKIQIEMHLTQKQLKYLRDALSVDIGNFKKSAPQTEALKGILKQLPKHGGRHL